MSRIQTTFENLKREKRKALIPFITAGDPRPEFTVPMLHAMAAAGADILELGVPFSDPMADGPVIQRASERALTHHVSLHQVLDMVAEFRRRDIQTPIVLMGYLNPLERMGYRAFAEAARKAGVDGVLTVDLPPEEAEAEMLPLLYEAGIDPIFLLAPTSTRGRIEKADAAGRGYLYYVSLKGVTGAGHLDLEEVARKVEEIRAAARLPIGVGFGVKNAETAAKMAQLADAVVVGSALVQKVEENSGDPERIETAIVALLKEMRAAMDKEARAA
ncbi:tryptophan synthase subunit alpha [Methylohalobius crimeensis]|uniref:tryptophan synthase subunit alpha n=1 Tax=Methylohalobius crimeensis TaxID=244365 RepID=UPI0003B3A8AA|nr:tryptophan synthase subunit alpha [Methylohalobius crimeensis]